MNPGTRGPQRAFDVIVVGGGHAGTEAAMAAARTGADTLLVTQSIEAIGQMSCNPAIGGIGKSHLVREIDALGGIMGRAADLGGIQFRVLNGRKGAAVRATRAQADRTLYRNAIRTLLEAEPSLALFQQTVTDLIVEGDRVRGIRTRAGVDIEAAAVVLATGTFLGGRIHIGLDNHGGGRAGDPAANDLARRLRALPLRVDRLKTGTPPRIDAASVDFSVMEQQWGDTPVPVFSMLSTPEDHPTQVCCYITRTNERTHALIAGALDRSPMYSGIIEGVGPRYCPSIEDKVVRFAERTSHQIFVEPEGLTSRELYPNGISTSLPFDVQVAMVQSIAGFESAFITRPGYAIEYDYFDPRDLAPSMASKHLDRLFFAGQINGTTGYEEAAAQGLLAGVNAARAVAGLPAWWPRRDEAYIGVMVDDLTTHGTREPYRMFTSRAEHRLLLREDNADLRLTERGRKLGLVDDDRWRRFTTRRDALEAARSVWKSTHIAAGSVAAERLSALIGGPVRDTTLYDLLRRPEVTPALAVAFIEAPASAPADEILVQLEIEAKYDGYITRQRAEVERLARHEQTRLPPDLDYGAIAGLSSELREKLLAQRPETLGRAGRIPGMTPAALSILLVHLKKVGLLTAAA